MSSRARVVCLLAATLVAVAVASPAMASLVDALTLLQSGQNNLTDVSGDLLVNGANGTSSTSQLVTKGSILLSAFSETQINGSNYGLPTETEISGVAALQVLSATNVGTVASPAYAYTFGPATSAADLAVIKTAAPALYTIMNSSSTWSAGTMMAVYDNSTAFLYQTTNPTLTQSINSATSGTEIWQFGYTGPTNVSGEATANTGEGWIAGGFGSNNFTGWKWEYFACCEF